MTRDEAIEKLRKADGPNGNLHVTTNWAAALVECLILLDVLKVTTPPDDHHEKILTAITGEHHGEEAD